MDTDERRRVIEDKRQKKKKNGLNIDRGRNKEEIRIKRGGDNGCTW